jgi:cobalt-zinc-cadmium efflux system membrane fusion protein
LVFLLLGGIFYLGHHTGWKIPKKSELFEGSASQADDWCSAHLVPESKCVECKVGLLPKLKEYGFCRKHGVAECVICHPDLAEVEGKPLLPRYDTIQPLALLPRPENNSRNTLHKSRIQFASAESAIRAGLDIDVVQEHRMTDAITANGELVFDPTRVAHLSSRVAGTVSHVFRIVGDVVRPGEILALIDAASVGQAKAQLLHSVVQLQMRRTTVERMRQAAMAGAISTRTILEAETAFREAQVGFASARQALVNLGFEVPDNVDREDPTKIVDDLRFLGIPARYVSAFPAGTMTANLIPVRAPYAGVVVSSTVVAGEVVGTTGNLFMVADPHRLWLMLNVRQEAAPYLSLGLPVVFHTDDGSQEATGAITWISSTIDERTRALQVRVNIVVQNEKLRDKTYGTGRILLREEPNAIVVPREAVQSVSDAHFIFVRDHNYLREASPKVFHVRQVRIGAKDDQHVELLAGALPGEVVATKGSPMLLAQLLRSSFGAGCGCHDD